MTVAATLLSVSMLFQTTVGLTLDGTEQDALEIARKGATLAGGAHYCKARIDDVELLTGRIEGLIAATSPDTVQTVFAKLEFKNLLAAARGKAPEAGCQAIFAALDSTLDNFR